MKKLFFNVFIIFSSILYFQAQSVDTIVLEEKPMIKKLPSNLLNVLQIGTLIGTDVGGGVPFGNIPKDFRYYPKLNISLGLWFNYIINQHWKVGITATYKTVALAADARMKNEYFAAEVPALTGNNEVVRVIIRVRLVRV